MTRLLFAVLAFFSIAAVAGSWIYIGASSAPAAFNAYTYGNPVWWTDGMDSSSASMTLSGASVVTWKNKGTTVSTDFTVAASPLGSTVPTLATNVVGSNSAVLFNGTTDVLQTVATTSFVPTNAPFTVVVLFQNTVVNDFGGIISPYNGFHGEPWAVGVGSTAGYSDFYWGVSFQVSGRTTLSNKTSWHLYEIFYNGAGDSTSTNYTVRLDGGSSTFSSTSGLEASFGNMIGFDGNDYFKGYIMETVIYPAVISGSTLTAMETALLAAAGI